MGTTTLTTPNDTYTQITDPDGALVAVIGGATRVTGGDDGAAPPGPTKGIERRAFVTKDLRVETRDDGTARLVGYAAVFDQSADDAYWGFREVIRPGAFTKTLADGADVRALFNHDPSLILGRTKAGTLNLREDDTGLYIELEPADTSYARDLLESIKRGDIDQMSFAFRVIRDRWTYNENDLDLRELLEVALYDVAPVTYPFYEGTSIGIDTKQMDVLVKRARNGDDRARAELIALAERANEFCTTEPDASHAPAPEPDEGHHPDAPDIGHSDGEKRTSIEFLRLDLELLGLRTAGRS